MPMPFLNLFFFFLTLITPNFFLVSLISSFWLKLSLIKKKKKKIISVINVDLFSYFQPWVSSTSLRTTLRLSPRLRPAGPPLPYQPPLTNHSVKQREFQNMYLKCDASLCIACLCLALCFYVCLKGEFTFFYSRIGCPPIRGVKLDGS